MSALRPMHAAYKGSSFMAQRHPEKEQLHSSTFILCGAGLS